MANMGSLSFKLSFVLCAFLLLYAAPVTAFGAGNIGEEDVFRCVIRLTESSASISRIEGHNVWHFSESFFSI